MLGVAVERAREAFILKFGSLGDGEWGVGESNNLKRG